MIINAKTLALQIVYRYGPCHGWRVTQLVNGQCGTISSSTIIPSSTMYRVLRELENEKLLVSKEQKPKLPDRGPTRRIYKVTEKGKKVAKENRGVVKGIFRF